MEQSRPLMWRELAKSVPGRSNKDCRRRWWNSLADGTAKGFWSEDEDERLMRAVNKYGTDWRRVAQEVISRTPDQCSSHWSQVLDPEINHCDWTGKEACSFHSSFTQRLADKE
ncbi:Homeodomain-like protein [Aspergillus pseudotamarii]|uniref:Homeodomain-like protein n=1 Tax=Aspergillus pseudotamarii TaxID=132259 RepID=A0A5N6SUS1_ASPPS|nr:Homeodomain-like protein [Aspergillus pseudotamarii]KAE8137490.1 Homeodomain-like protein [Aspergillus pseudotamarii]